MDRLTSHLNYKTGNAYHPSLSAAMKLARNKMNRYYSLTDSSNVYRIAMVLHPGMKLEYFRNQKWEEEWIEQAENLVREEYISSYERVPEETNTTPPENADADNDSGFASFGNLSVTTCPRESEIQEYLSLPVENVKNPLKWWEDNKHIYPSLHRMALDYISIPGTYYIRVSTPKSDHDESSYFHLRRARFFARSPSPPIHAQWPLALLYSCLSLLRVLGSLWTACI